MNLPLSPIVSEFETAEDEAEYAAWLRAKAERSLADPRPGVPHDAVMASMDDVIRKAAARGKAKAG